MSEAVTIPAPEQIAVKIRETREKLAALKRLHKLASAAKKADIDRDVDRVRSEGSVAANA